MTTECTCFMTDPKYWTTHGGATEPGSMWEPNPDCPQHFPKPDRVKVACINWGTAPHLEGAPKATVYILSDGEAKVNTYHDTWAEAMGRGNYLAQLLTKGTK